MNSPSLRIAAIAAALLFTLQLSAQTYYKACPAPPADETAQAYGLASDGTHIWIACWDDDVYEINISNGALVRNITGLTGPMSLVYDNVNGNIWVSSFSVPEVWKIKASSGEVLQTVTVGGDSPRGMAFDGTYVWVANEVANSISKVLATTGAVTTYPISSSSCLYPFGVAYDGIYVRVTCPGSDSEIGAVIGLNAEGEQLQWAGFTWAFGISVASGDVWVGSASTGDGVNTLMEITGGGTGFYFFDNLFASYDVAAAGTYTWVTSFSGVGGQGEVKKILASDGALVETYAVNANSCIGYTPNCIISDGQGNIWVTVLSTGGGQAPQVAKIPD